MPRSSAQPVTPALPPADHDDYRYETVAQFIHQLIESGALAPGAKAPSLRKVSKARGVSVTTALHAYRMLESQGILEAQPQSGFYVRDAQAMQAETPSTVPLSTRQRNVTAGNLVADMFEHAGNRSLAPLGCAIPSPELLATSQLDKFLSRAARVRGKACNTYASPRGDLELRSVISRRSILWGQAISPEDIIVTGGCTEALHLALKTLSNPGDTIAVESPNYFGFLPILQALHLKVTEIPTDALSGLSVDALASVLNKGGIKACLFSSAFNNPLGCLIDEEKKVAVLDLLNQHRVPLIEDDVYGDIYFGNERPRPYSALKNVKNVIYCSSFSKTVAPGYRIGWIASPTIANQILVNKYATSLCGPVLTQVAMADYLNGGAYDNHLRGLRRAFSNNLATMSTAIKETFPAGTRISRPAGGFVLWVELPNSIDTRVLLDRALKHDICFAPGDLFTTSDNYKSCLRISCGYPWDSTLERAIWKLGHLAGL